MGSIDSPPGPTGVEMLEVDVLIVGAGPSGASLACYLGLHGRFYALYVPTTANHFEQE